MARQTKIPKLKGVRYVRVSNLDIQKWDAKANRDLADNQYYGGGKEFSFWNPVWKNDVGHGAWDDEEPGPDEKNLTSRWTCWPMTQFLRRRRTVHLEASMVGDAHEFFGMVANLFMHRWPPVWCFIFIDYTGSARKVALHLVGVRDSPGGAPFPRMDKGFLDLGPGLALDRCELVILTPEMRDTFGEELEALHVQVKQWFPNNEWHMTSGKGLKSVLKPEIEKKRAPQAQHVFSRELYKSEIRQKVEVEAARMGKSPNNIGLISKITRVEWKKATPEVTAEIMSIQSVQKKQIAAAKAHRYDEMDLSAEQKQQAIESLGVEFKKLFGLCEAVTDWGFLVIGAGIEPRSGNLQSCSWEYGTHLASGAKFFETFERDAAIGLVPGRLVGDTRQAHAYYSGPLLAHMRNVERVKAQQQKPEESVASSSSMDVDTVARDVPEMAGNDDLPLLPDDPPQGKSSSDTVDEPLPDEPIPDEPPQGKSSADEPLPLLSPNRLPDFPFPLGSNSDIDLLLAAWNTSQSSIPSDDSMYNPSSQNSFQNDALSFQFPQGNPVYRDPTFLQLLQNNSFPVISEFQPNIPAPSSSDDIWSGSFSWNNYNHISPGPSLPNPTYSNYISFQNESNMPSMAFPLTPSTSSAASSFPSATMQSKDTAMSEIETTSDLATKNQLQEPTRSNQASAEVHPRSLSKRSAEQAPAPVIPQRARNRKAPGPREVKTLVGSKQSTPVWQLQSLASMQDPTFGVDWANMLDRWSSLETILSKEKTSGKLQAPKNWPRVLAIWLDGVRSFSDLLSINEIDQFGHSMVTWWNSIQPTWRQSVEGLPLPKYDELFACLRKGGQNGIVTVIFGLFWWRKNLDGSSQWHALVTDVSNTLDALLHATVPGKCCIR
ncbi:uncharacterized protein ARMOST_15946 [Armillaria ostoyae]|uniref:Uncharacterized protein n=1 Tax=Armillaria ostoyae TaxID=47428 RepID=A0A284RUS2_ARMOS|nr:uncharacterized protein ARMOST_15946 [Armillaria ostoyae]